MSKNIIKISEKELKEFVEESIKIILDKNTAYSDSLQILNETKTNNTDKKNEDNKSKSNSFEIKLYGDKHNPPNFNVKRNKQSVSFIVENGSSLEIIDKTNNQKIILNVS